MAGPSDEKGDARHDAEPMSHPQPTSRSRGSALLDSPRHSAGLAGSTGRRRRSPPTRLARTVRRTGGPDSVQNRDDQRRVPLTSAPAGTGAYTVFLPADKGVVLPGMYMLFGLGAQGAPSNARVITVTDPAAG